MLHHLYVAIFQVKGYQQFAVGICLEAVGIRKFMSEPLIVIEFTVHHDDNHSVGRTDRLVTTVYANNRQPSVP